MTVYIDAHLTERELTAETIAAATACHEEGVRTSQPRNLDKELVMGMFNILFPKEAAQLKLNSRRLSALMAGSGLDDESNPALAGVITELRAGRDIKASQLYSEAMGVGVGESQVAVQELKGQLRV